MNPARREPLLWLQLLGLAALPLEALLLLLVLAGADPGPFPGFERVLAWALGALAPAVLFWRLPPDLWSLLLVQVPLRGRRPEQMRLSALQTALPLRVIAASGAALLLPLLWRLDAGAGLAWAWSPPLGQSTAGGVAGERATAGLDPLVLPNATSRRPVGMALCLGFQSVDGLAGSATPDADVYEVHPAR